MMSGESPSGPNVSEGGRPFSEPFSYAVITVCLNSARTLQRTIDSVLQQTVAPAQYIFVDGGSTDGTMDIIRRAIDHTSAGSSIDFKLLDQGGERGITTAWNIGLRHVAARWVFILNSDDWYEPGCVQTVGAAIANQPETEIVAAGTNNFPRGGTHALDYSLPRPDWVMPFAMAYVHPACFVRKSVYDRIGIFDPAYRYCADYDFLYRCRVQGVRFLRLPERLVNFEMGGAANSHRKDARREMCAIGCRHAKTPVLPVSAFLLRAMLGR
jgi:GT2 family glycosyltransferase